MELLIKHVPCEEHEQVDLINGAINLFRDVDLNSDGCMEWDEFIKYIMDTVINESITPSVDPNSGKY